MKKKLQDTNTETLIDLLVSNARTAGAAGYSKDREEFLYHVKQELLERTNK